MQADLEVIRGNGVPHPAHPVLLLALGSSVRALHLTVGNGVGKEALLLLRIVDTQRRANHEVLERRDADVRITEHTPHGVLVVLVVSQQAQRVLTLRVGTQRLGILAVLGIDGEVGVELQRILQDTAGSIDTLGAVDGEVLADDHLAVEQLVVGIGTGRQTAELRVLDGTQVVVVSHREERRALLRAVAHRQVVLLYHTRAGDLLEPVGISRAHRGILVNEHIHRQAVQHGVAHRVVAPVELIAQIVVVRILTVVHAGLPEGTAPLFGIHRLNLVLIERGSHRRVEVHLHLAVLTLLGGDDDDTVRGTRTVDTGRGSVLQHLDRLDVVTVQLVHTGLRRHTVDDVQRVVVVQRADTTDAHRRSTRQVTVGLDVHARHTALQGLHRVVLVLLGQFADAHHAHRTRQVGLALGGIARHHHFVQRQGVVLHHDLHAVLGGQLLGLIANVGEHQRLAGLHLQCEVTVEVGHRTVRRPFLHHRGTDDGLTRRIDHRTGDSTHLRVHYITRQQDEETQNESFSLFHLHFCLVSTLVH